MRSVLAIIRSLFFGFRDFQALPRRIEAAFRQQQDQSERLIGWFQLSVVLLFGLLYIISPKTHMSGFWGSPVPWGLCLYLIFTALRLVLSYRYSLPDWYLSLSGLVDLVLLFGIIWSFHIQYNQPAVFYLKAPTMLYVFIFIALRTLRFDPRHVFYTGLAAALGWLGMVGYAVFSVDDGMSRITRDYVAYLTDNLVLLGGEFDKVITIVTVTVILTFALMRGRRFLLQAVTGEIQKQALSRFFAPEVAERIKGADGNLQAGQGETCTGSVVNVDIRGFTKLAATMSPPQVMQLLSEYQAHILPVIQKYGGSVDKFLGDGIMVSFGAARPSDTFARDALYAMEDVLDAARAWNDERYAKGLPVIDVAVSAASGVLIFGVVGDENRLEYTVVGTPVNLSAKLEKHNKVLGSHALCDRETIRLAREQGWQPRPQPKSLKELPDEAVDGVSAPITLFVLS